MPATAGSVVSTLGAIVGEASSQQPDTDSKRTGTLGSPPLSHEPPPHAESGAKGKGERYAGHDGCPHS